MPIFKVNFVSNFFSGRYTPFELRNLAKIRYTTETVCQGKSSETAQQHFVKICSYEEQTV